MASGLAPLRRTNPARPPTPAYPGGAARQPSIAQADGVGDAERGGSRPAWAAVTQPGRRRGAPGSRLGRPIAERRVSGTGSRRLAKEEGDVGTPDQGRGAGGISPGQGAERHRQNQGPTCRAEASCGGAPSPLAGADRSSAACARRAGIGGEHRSPHGATGPTRVRSMGSARCRSSERSSMATWTVTWGSPAGAGEPRAAESRAGSPSPHLDDDVA